jgi:hypothetical protein
MKELIIICIAVFLAAAFTIEIACIFLAGVIIATFKHLIKND